MYACAFVVASRSYGSFLLRVCVSGLNKRMLGELGKTWMSFRDVRDVLMCVNR